MNGPKTITARAFQCEIDKLVSRRAISEISARKIRAILSGQDKIDRMDLRIDVMGCMAGAKPSEVVSVMKAMDASDGSLRKRKPHGNGMEEAEAEKSSAPGLAGVRDIYESKDPLRQKLLAHPLGDQLLEAFNAFLHSADLVFLDVESEPGHSEERASMFKQLCYDSLDRLLSPQPTPDSFKKNLQMILSYSDALLALLEHYSDYSDLTPLHSTSPKPDRDTYGRCFDYEREMQYICFIGDFTSFELHPTDVTEEIGLYDAWIALLRHAVSSECKNPAALIGMAVTLTDSEHPSSLFEKYKHGIELSEIRQLISEIASNSEPFVKYTKAHGLRELTELISKTGVLPAMGQKVELIFRIRNLLNHDFFNNIDEDDRLNHAIRSYSTICAHLPAQYVQKRTNEIADAIAQSPELIGQDSLEGYKWFFKYEREEQFDNRLRLLSEYHGFFGNALLLKTLFERFEAANDGERAHLADAFRQINGWVSHATPPEPSTDLPEAVIEEMSCASLNSKSMDLDTFRKYRSLISGKTIPPPNFKSGFSLSFDSMRLANNELTENEKQLVSAISEKLNVSDPEDAIAEELVRAPHFLAKAGGELGKALADADSERLQHMLGERNLDGARTLLSEAIKKSGIDGKKALDGLVSMAWSEKMTVKKARRIAPLLACSLRLSNDTFKSQVERVMSAEDASRSVARTLDEVVTEMLSKTPEAVRPFMAEALEAGRLSKITKSAKKKGEYRVDLTFLPAKTEMDCFYGYFGDTCLTGYPEEILNEAFTPLRIVSGDRIMGVVHTLTFEIEGKKALVLAGIEPKQSLVDRVNAQEFTEMVLESIIREIAVPNDYGMVCLSTGDGSLSNRREILEQLDDIIETGARKIKQDAHPGFPKEYSEGNLEELAVIWEMH
ncbi:MAG: hypothetical protein V1861_00575 [Candidatus Micrarchaeota archaeon]